MRTLDIIVAAPGRAGGALAIAADKASHRIVGVVTRTGSMANRFSQSPYDADLPDADLLVIATRDDHIESTAVRLAPYARNIRGAVHMSGFKSIDVLAPFARSGIGIGSYHPLQSLSDPETGARSLAGAWAGVTADEPLFGLLTGLATSLGMVPFRLLDSVKPVYHAAASAASNYVVAALDLAGSLLESASIPFEAVAPLTRTAVSNAFVQGPRHALTGPIARGDWETVKGQLSGVARTQPDRLKQFRLMAEATAITAGKSLPEDLDD
ncbi:MAG TPA: DUF2520 domain-containing protein [Acidimicrobiia bacterium]|nr:DUF2520 domain-containing protein [Acidimicrobiia bacterium]